ncbi:hypothetical protein LP420_09895 [Massilia sp. B-10]|nr:hypothetical protein LP420_09895 [Massilia sp. B-10]
MARHHFRRRAHSRRLQLPLAGRAAAGDRRVRQWHLSDAQQGGARRAGRGGRHALGRRGTQAAQCGIAIAPANR